MTDDLQVSVVLPTHGRKESLLRVLSALAEQTISPSAFEVIVICDGDDDGSGHACRDVAVTLPFELRVLDQENQGPAMARNLGVREAQAPLIIFLDDDVIPDTALIAGHVAARAGQEDIVTIGPLLPPPDAHLTVWAEYEERLLCRQYADMAAGKWDCTWRQFYTGNAAARKRDIVDAGWFDPEFRRAEDVELAFRMHQRGLRFVFLPHARGWHFVSRRYAAWLPIASAYGRADVTMARSHDPRILKQLAKEFRQRHPGVQLVVTIVAGRAAVETFVVPVLSALILLLNRARFIRRRDLACSLLFNICYYDGVARALGGRPVFD
ncbi:MAG: glycosyltransferase family 2 protein, partial [Chloroflexota bacterium]